MVALGCCDGGSYLRIFSIKKTSAVLKSFPFACGWETGCDHTGGAAVEAGLRLALENNQRQGSTVTSVLLESLRMGGRRNVVTRGALWFCGWWE